MENMPELYPGDIGAVEGKGVLRWLCEHAITPPTSLVHFFIVGDYLPWYDDYVILESIGKGVAVGRLSFYDAEKLAIFRVKLNPDDMEIRRQAAASLTSLGRAKYDYRLILALAFGALMLRVRCILPPWRPQQFPYGRNDRYICTEAASEAWRAVGQPIIPMGVVPLPAGFIQAYHRGRLEQVYPLSNGPGAPADRR